jgi:prepilin-type N-terminal cleavage/methylation domain-containing protein
MALSPGMRGNDEGYTLLETLVAMVLFGIALLPLSSILLTLTENRSAEVLSRALIVAVSNLNEVDADSLRPGVTTVIHDGFLCNRRTLIQDRLASIDVTVSRIPDTSRILVTLHREMLIRWRE